MYIIKARVKIVEKQAIKNKTINLCSEQKNCRTIAKEMYDTKHNFKSIVSYQISETHPARKRINKWCVKSKLIRLTSLKTNENYTKMKI